MELLFVTLGGAILGAIARYALPRRHLYGSALLPALGAGVAALVWVGLTWAGLKWDGGWIWVITLVVAAVVSVGTPLLLGPARERGDAAAFARLSRGGA